MNAPKSTFACYDCILLGDTEIKWMKSIGSIGKLHGNLPNSGSGSHDVTYSNYVYTLERLVHTARRTNVRVA